MEALNRFAGPLIVTAAQGATTFTVNTAADTTDINAEVGWTAGLDLNQTSTTGLINTVDVGFDAGRLGNACSPAGS